MPNVPMVKAGLLYRIGGSIHTGTSGASCCCTGGSGDNTNCCNGVRNIQAVLSGVPMPSGCVTLTSLCDTGIGRGANSFLFYTFNVNGTYCLTDPNTPQNCHYGDQENDVAEGNWFCPDDHSNPEIFSINFSLIPGPIAYGTDKWLFRCWIVATDPTTGSCDAFFNVTTDAANIDPVSGGNIGDGYYFSWPCTSSSITITPPAGELGGTPSITLTRNGC